MQTDQELTGEQIVLRCIKLEDCSTEYLDWLENPLVNQYLETRWTRQTVDSIRAFVREVLTSEHSWLFAIMDKGTGRHVGNIKLGPVNFHHGFADVSYFIGSSVSWGKGYATEAIRLATQFGFQTLSLWRVQAGVYAGNIGSCRALEKAGFQLEGRYRRKLKTPSGYQDHLIYGVLAEEWR